MGHIITRVVRGGAARRAGVRAGDTLETVSGESIIDEIDYQALTSAPELTLLVTGKGGEKREIKIRKDEGEPLGLCFADSMALKPRACRNKCVFCFIDQLPPDMRQTLYVKDDDWRMSLMMGNYVTLTNVDDAEFERIISRRASPLYISVHATDPALRKRIMNNRFAGSLMERLNRLKDAGLRYHCQIVLCPGINDGEALIKTLRDLISLAPAVMSVAIVPVGLTKYREGLEQIRPLTKEDAERLLDDIAPLQEECRSKLGTTLLFPSDEIYCQASLPVPPDEWYEDYPQIENGVGLLRLLETELSQAASELGNSKPSRKSLLIPTGVSAYPTIERLVSTYAPEGARIKVVPIVNRFFGESVTVTGLITGGDLIAQLKGDTLSGVDEVLISGCMLRNEQDRFLDDVTLKELSDRLGKPVRVVGSSGRELYLALRA